MFNKFTLADAHCGERRNCDKIAHFHVSVSRNSKLGTKQQSV